MCLLVLSFGQEASITTHSSWGQLDCWEWGEGGGSKAEYLYLCDAAALTGKLF